jgi:hypothetical protein
MGAWGHNSFENDSALDWADALCLASNITPVVDTLKAVVEKDDYIEVDEGSAAIAAGEVVAALKGMPSVYLLEKIASWVQQNPLDPSAELISLALQAAERVADGDSELKELWEESNKQPEWLSAISDLKMRLQA